MCAGFASFKSWVKVHRVKVALAVLVCVLLVSAVFASTFFRSSQAGPTVTLVSPPFEFSMTMDKTEFQLGENITLRFSLRNVSNETAHVEVGSAYYFSENDVHPMLVGFVVTAENGTEVYRWYARAPSLCVSDYMDIGSGEALNATYSWDQLANFPNDVPRPLYSWPPVPAGTYYIRGVVPPGSDGAAVSINSGAWMMLETASIMFTIG